MFNPYTGSPFFWNHTRPSGCPLPQSYDFARIEFTGKHAEYEHADTWYPSWASDGNMYSPWTDGNVAGVNSGSADTAAITGFATIVGDDPLHLKITNVGTYPSSPLPYHGRYPCGSLVYNGVWYYGTYCLNPSGSVTRNSIVCNWPWLGPFSLAFAIPMIWAKHGRRRPARLINRCLENNHLMVSQSRSVRRTSWTSEKTWSIHRTAKPTLWLMELRSWHPSNDHQRGAG